MRAPQAPVLRLLFHIGLLLPLALLLWDFTNNQLTANPIQAATLRTGKIALVLLVLCLASTPAYSLLGFRLGLRVRRTFGLYAMAYAFVHVMIFVGLDYGFDWALLQEAIFAKRYALAGLVSFLLLMPLAITSTSGWGRRLGRTWSPLQRVIYVASLAAVLHYLWLVKVDTREPLEYGAAVLLLLLVRLPVVRQGMHRLRCWLVGPTGFGDQLKRRGGSSP